MKTLKTAKTERIPSLGISPVIGDLIAKISSLKHVHISNTKETLKVVFAYYPWEYVCGGVG